jgi:hypothetical protein
LVLVGCDFFACTLFIGWFSHSLTLSLNLTKSLL